MRWVLVLAVLALLATTHGLDLGRKHHRKHHGRRQSGSGSSGMKFTPQQLTDARTFLAKNKWAHGGGATDQTFWHWTTMETCIRLSRDGKMSDGEMDFLTSEHKGMRAGGGFYLAHDPRTSAEFGPCPLEVIVAKDALILLEEDLENSKFLAIFGGKNLTDIDKVQLGKELGFIHNHGPRKTVQHPSWWVTHSTKFIKQLVIGAPKMIQNLPWVGVYKLPTGMDQVAFGFQKEHAGWPKYAVNKSYEVFNLTWTIRDAFQKRGAGYQDVVDSLNWLESFFHLFQYIDGITLVAGVRRTQNPWSLFDQENFETFRKFNQELVRTRQSTPGYPWGVTTAKSKVFGGEGADKEWARKMVALLMSVYKGVSGTNIDYRTAEVRAGGDEPKKTFKATKGMVDVLEANEYLIVNKEATADPTVFLVHYYYPDPLHLNPRLKNRVPAALWTTIQSSQAAYATDKKKLAADTKELVTALTLDAFLSSWFKEAPDMQGLVNLMIKLVSVHPCDNFNGRSTRMMGFILGQDYNQENPPIGFFTDFDLVMPTTSYAEFLKRQTAAYHKLRLTLLANAIQAVATKQVPKHFEDTFMWDNFLNECMSLLKPAGGKAITIDAATDWPLIEKRRWIDFLDKKWPAKDWKFR